MDPPQVEKKVSYTVRLRNNEGPVVGEVVGEVSILSKPNQITISEFKLRDDSAHALILKKNIPFSSPIVPEVTELSSYMLNSHSQEDITLTFINGEFYYEHTLPVEKGSWVRHHMVFQNPYLEKGKTHLRYKVSIFSDRDQASFPPTLLPTVDYIFEPKE
jgi:hypothetical protein